MISWWGFLLMIKSFNHKNIVMITKILSWVCPKFKTENSNKDPFGNDPFAVL